MCPRFCGGVRALSASLAGTQGPSGRRPAPARRFERPGQSGSRRDLLDVAYRRNHRVITPECGRFYPSVSLKSLSIGPFSLMPVPPSRPSAPARPPRPARTELSHSIWPIIAGHSSRVGNSSALSDHIVTPSFREHINWVKGRSRFLQTHEPAPLLGVRDMRCIGPCQIVSPHVCMTNMCCYFRLS